MQWVRVNRRFGAWCALVAITLQVVLSFGHAHRTDGLRSVGPLRTIHLQTAAAPSDPALPLHGPAFEYCAICAVINMGAAAVPPEAPASNVPAVAGGVRFAAHAEALLRGMTHQLFQARGPPSA
jgi:hypothetical protein